MKFLMNLSDLTKGIVLIVAGVILLFNTLGIAHETLNTIVLLGAICMILIGIYLSNAYQKMYQLITKQTKKYHDSGNSEE